MRIIIMLTKVILAFFYVWVVPVERQYFASSMFEAK